MKDFKEQYYITNIPWQRKLNYDDLVKFDIKPNDTIIFHFDFWYSVFKIRGIKPDKRIFISGINACLRYYQIIRKIYPYNNVRVIIHQKQNYNQILNYSAFKSIIDIIPNFAIVQDSSDLEYFNKSNYKHIFYGMFTKLPENSDYQKWSVMNGNLIIRGKKNNDKI